MRANALVPAGILSQLSDGETSLASQVYLRGISAPLWKAELLSSIAPPPFVSDPKSVETIPATDTRMPIKTVRAFLGHIQVIDKDTVIYVAKIVKVQGLHGADVFHRLIFAYDELV